MLSFNDLYRLCYSRVLDLEQEERTPISVFNTKTAKVAGTCIATQLTVKECDQRTNEGQDDVR